MIKDYLDPRNAEGMPNLADATIATDFLLSVKNGIMNCAVALTEVTSDQARQALTQQLSAGIALHTEIIDLMMEKGWLYPHDLRHQADMDVGAAETARQIASLDLFPGNTNRLGNFATPKQ